MGKGVMAICMVLWAGYVLGQTQTDDNVPVETDSLDAERNSIIGLPILFYSPETLWGVGAGGIYAFRTSKGGYNCRPGQVRFGAVYTQEKQILMFARFQFFPDMERYNVYGEVGYFLYNYFFHGIGNDQDPDFEELYDVDYPRFRITALKEVRPYLYMGPRYWYDNFVITNRDPDGQLIEDRITGSAGGVVSSAGFVVNFDDRDNLFYPGRGHLVEGVMMTSQPALGSNYRFTRVSLDAAKYVRTKWDHVIAANYFTDLTFGNVPFNQLALLGGGRKMRGYYRGRYRDKKMMITQVEYRAPLFWRLGVVGFAGYGGVAEDFTGFALKDMRYTYGGGVRFLLDRKKQINIRIDAGFGRDTDGIYVTVGEAF